MLLVNSQPATVLFDCGASYSFISNSFAALSDLQIVPIHVLLIIHSPGSKMRAEKECRDVSIEIGGVGFLPNLILLNSESLDVILGMDWLSQHLGQIDCAKKFISLTSPSSEQVEISSKCKNHIFSRLKRSWLWRFMKSQ